MNEVVVLALIVALAGSGYGAGRLHGQLGYRLGYRFGYRQGYFDGDRSSWNRRRRELQAAVSAVLTTPLDERAEAFPPQQATGTTYASTAAVAEDGDEDGFGPPYEAGQSAPTVPPARLPTRAQRGDWALVDARPAPPHRSE